MRVLVSIFEQLVPISGGGTPRISSIIDVLIKRGHEVSVAASFATDTIEALQTLRCNKILPLNNVSRLDKNKMKKYLLFHPLNIFKVVQEAMKSKPDLIIAHNAIAGLPSLLTRKTTKSLAVLDMTDLIFQYLTSYERAWTTQIERIGEKIENKVIRESDKIITISQIMKQTLVHKGAKPDKVEIVYDGVRSNLFKPRIKEAEALREKYADGVENIIMHHGVIDPQDHPEIIVGAAEGVIKQHPNTMFWLIGNGAAIPDIKEKIRRKNLEKHFFLSGWVPYEDMPSFISACDAGLVILPDISSARVRVTLKGFEYWACEKPIVSSDLPALREIIDPGQTGLFYKPDDPKDLAERICMLLEDKPLSKRMGQAGRRLVENKYDWEKLATQFVMFCECMSD
ncbi:MAG: glycosyltransferase family 4 protein [Candidatus Bathyarchaeota archaeon]|nr:MAG: glycosyltransferase family 4 protein [Candidatus Bathyarchaeota archaeon]